MARRLLAENAGRMGMLFELAATRIVSAEDLHDVDPQLLSFRNLNTPQEYSAALAECAQARAGQGDSG
jgi:molybdopterin-guanine dinucleotide biosynthesis protein A